MAEPRAGARPRPRRPRGAEILVTGATGFLGRHLLERLVAEAEEGRPVRILARRAAEERPAGPVEIVEGGLDETAAIRRAVRGIRRIYHLAGRVSRDPADARALYDLHVEGTRRLCREAKRAGVERIVLASTSGTIAVTRDGEAIPDESWPPPLEIIGRWPYYTSKLYQERVALEECAGGPELVILNPSLLLGPGDRRLSSTEDVLRFLNGDIPAVPPGGLSFTDVRDAAEAFRVAMERGRAGERYLLGGPNWTFERFFARLERIAKVRGPRLRLPEPLFEWSGRALDALYRRLGRTPPVDRVSVEMSRYFWYCDAGKAERELGFAPRDPYETLYETVADLKRTFLGDGTFG